MKTFTKFYFLLFFIISILFFSCTIFQKSVKNNVPASDDGSWFFLNKEDLSAGDYHTKHTEIFGKNITGYNYIVLQGIDIVQAHAMDGGGYFIGLKANPPESPIGYELKLFGSPLIAPPRRTSYCSGSTYSAFIEALDLIFPNGEKHISPERVEAIRMQEPDGGRREDEIKFWGHWNDDGFGSHYALVQYADMGVEIKPEQARPGDFMNISWKKGGGHSVIFLGWYIDEKGKKNIVFWSSQAGTNGFADVVTSIDRILDVKIVRLTKPENIFDFDINRSVNRKIPGDSIKF